MSRPTVHDDLIITAVRTAFNVLKTASADYHVVAKKIYDSENAPIGPNDRPAYNIAEGDEQFLQEDASRVYHDNTLQINIDIIASSASECRKMKADAMKIIKANLNWGLSWVLESRYLTTQRNVIDHLGNLVAERRIIIEVQYRKTAWSD